MFLHSFNYFRAIAIIFVVLAHSYIPAGWQPSSGTLFERFQFDLMMNGTVFFVFISGFLFHHVFVPRYQFKKFMVKKIKFVLMPYLFLSILPILFWLYWAPIPAPHESLYAGHSDLQTAIWYVLTGRQLTAYWYIPMVMVLFAITPFVLWLDKRNWLMHAAIPLLIISALIHRPVSNLSAVQSLFYFFPVFLIGAWASQHKDLLYQKLARKEIWLLIVAVALAAIQALFTDQIGNSQKDAFEWAGIDYSLFQKILLCFALMVFLHRFEDKEWGWMNTLANVSFAVYFIHPWFTTTWRLYYPTPDTWSSAGNLLTTLGVCAILIGLSILVAKLFKAIFKSKSRYLIGW
ncbi:acyltransferase family protein [Echinimonas agarilytica]|uniref:Acyltransferase n=1 Tax=Echinimonas agarilytica TaxID=1215918 RepID=A0AA42B840_9GAMM|nr:acyltransferase [Echinimonas agarilytica]